MRRAQTMQTAEEMIARIQYAQLMLMFRIMPSVARE
jgi:hypothetical protein